MGAANMRISVTLFLSIALIYSALAGELVIVGATLIDGTGSEPKPATTVVIRDGRIASIGTDQDAPVPENATVINAQGKYLVPGFADMHVHFGSGGLYGSSTVERLLRQYLFYGVTTVFNLGATNGGIDDIREFRRRDEEGDLLAPNIYATGGLITVPGSHPVGTIMFAPDGQSAEEFDWTSRGVWIVSTKEQIESIVVNAAAAGMDGVKIVIESGPPPFGDDHRQMSSELVQAAVDAAEKQGLKVYAHCSSPDELEIAVAAGVHAVVHIVGRPELPSDALLSEMANKNIYYVPTLSVTVWADVWGDPADNLKAPFLQAGVEDHVTQSLLSSPLNSSEPPGESDWAIRRFQLKALRTAFELDIPIVLGTDTANPNIFPGYSVHHELELMVEAGLSPMQALVAATKNAAEMIGQADEFGTIETGKRADILILRDSPLADIRNTRSLETVIQAGEVLDRSSLLSQ
jgi:imidazolonepropionase-like amidohydrolase